MIHVHIQDWHEKPEKSDKQKADEITQLVCDTFFLTETEIKSKIRKHRIVTARQILMYLVRRFTKLSLKEIGVYCTPLDGGIAYDHTSVMHSYEKVMNYMEYDEIYKQDIDKLINKAKRI